MNKLNTNGRVPDKWAEINSRLNLAAGLLLVAIAIVILALKLGG